MFTLTSTTEIALRRVSTGRDPGRDKSTGGHIFPPSSRILKNAGEERRNGREYRDPHTRHRDIARPGGASSAPIVAEPPAIGWAPYWRPRRRRVSSAGAAGCVPVPK